MKKVLQWDKIEWEGDFMATKVFFYTLRPYDEQGLAERLAPKMGVEFGATSVTTT